MLEEDNQKYDHNNQKQNGKYDYGNICQKFNASVHCHGIVLPLVWTPGGSHHVTPGIGEERW